MASIYKTVSLDAPVGEVWAAVADFGALHTRLVPGFVTNTQLDGDARIVTFGNGTAARETLVDCDHARRRLVYAISNERITQHSASVLVVADGSDRCRLEWSADLLPNEIAGYVSTQMDLGLAAMANHFKDNPCPSRSFRDALSASGPAADRGAHMDLYGWLIGAWELDVVHYMPDGKERRRQGEWHFGWVLEGRAIQDVWIVPKRGAQRDGDAEANAFSYGTTLRVYDPRIDAWQIQWSDPVISNFLTMIGRKEENDIVQLGRDREGRPIRWSFSNITTQSFLWRGETSPDDGKTWSLDVQFAAQRM
jgi:Polyketide cyclase / dehydrase and lipid transport